MNKIRVNIRLDPITQKKLDKCEAMLKEKPITNHLTGSLIKKKTELIRYYLESLLLHDPEIVAITLPKINKICTQSKELLDGLEEELT